MPMVAISTATAGWPDSGRSTARSTSTASTPMTPSAMMNDSHGASSNVTAQA